MNILNIGSVSYDKIIQVSEINEITDDLSLWANSTYEGLGSTGAGKALCLEALGVSSDWITYVGNDNEGSMILSDISQMKNNVHLYKTDKSIAHTNIMHGKGKRISITTSFPTNEEEINPDKYSHLIQNADIVLLNINNYARKFIPEIKKQRKMIIVDLHDYDTINPYHKEFIEAADILFTSGVNIKDPKPYMLEHIKCGKLLSVVTLGDKGYIAIDSTRKTFRGQILKGIEHVDSNGAGDSFVAGFATEFLKTRNIDQALHFANACGAVSCSSKRLFHPEYTYDDVKKLLKKS